MAFIAALSSSKGFVPRAPPLWDRHNLWLACLAPARMRSSNWTKPILGKKKNNRHRMRTAAAGRKTAVMTLIDREGDVKTVKVPNVRKGTLQALARPIVD